MRFVVGAIEILSVPACRERNGRSDASTTLLVWEGGGISTRAGRTTEWILRNILLTTMAQLLLHVFARSEHGVTDNHPETRLEGGGLGFAIVW
jgi:hypothetical protein